MKFPDRHEVTITFVFDLSEQDIDPEDIKARLDRSVEGLPQRAHYFTKREAHYENNRLVLAMDYKRPRGM